MDVLKVITAQIKLPHVVSKKDKQPRQVSGCIIEFDSIENIVTGTKLALTYNNTIHYFEANEISINLDNSLKVIANEVGYWAHKFDRMNDLDIRSLINLDVEVITDKELISKIHEMSCWC